MNRPILGLLAMLGTLSCDAAVATKDTPHSAAQSPDDINLPAETKPSTPTPTPDLLNKEPDLSILDKSAPALPSQSEYRQIGGIQTTQRKLGDSGITFLRK